MTKEYEIPRKMPRYLKRLAVEYRNGGETGLADVLEGSKFQVIEETGYDNWDGGMDGHDLVLLVPDDLMGHITVDKQHEVQNRLREDLNKAASAAQAEFVHEVHFEYLEDDDQDASNARSLVGPTVSKTTESRLWLPNTIRLFISHRDTWKELAHELAEELERFGISSFVAHDTIEPDEDWQKEIEKALQTMNAMLAVITDDFFDSAWTNQEIGFALARSIPVISIKFETIDPVGFIRNRQAIKSSPKKMSENARKVFETVEKRLGGSIVYRTSMLSRFIKAISFAEAEAAFEPVSRMQNFSTEEMNELIAAFNSNSQIYGCWALTRGNRYLDFLNQHSAQKLAIRDNKIVEVDADVDDEISFGSR